MIKNNKWKVIISSIIILLPCLAGLIFWNRLPDTMAVHFGAEGNADGFAPKLFVVVGIPVILLLIHLLCLFITSKDKGNKNQNEKALGIIFWIIPVISVFISGVMYYATSDIDFNIAGIVFGLLGVLFIFIGNYLPKCKQNFTLGIKLRWTLANEENWNATHRFGGKVWVIGGFVMLLCIFIPVEMLMWFFIPLVLLIVLIPALYSYLYYKKQVKEGKAPKKPEIPVKNYKKIYIITIILVLAIVAAILVIMFTGEIKIEFGDSSFEVKASYFEDICVDYDKIASIELRNDCETGVKTYGFNSAKLLLGSFKNEEFGKYTRYSYVGCKSCVILEIDGETLVLSGKDEADTKEILQKIVEKTTVD